MLSALPEALDAQDHNPFANDPKAAEAGKSHFRINCALCHGLGAHGGARGPDLTPAQKRHGNSDAEMFRTIHDGDPAHGKTLFFGTASCSRCHMVEGKGGRLGPDLTGVAGSRSLDSLVESVREPSKQIVPGYETATVVTADGKDAKGYVMNEDRFSVQMMDTRENILLLDKGTLRSFEKSPVSLMPPYTASALSDKDLQDIIGYLLTVSAK
jgi:putative heme-binding domain-containing protein